MRKFYLFAKQEYKLSKYCTVFNIRYATPLEIDLRCSKLNELYATSNLIFDQMLHFGSLSFV